MRESDLNMNKEYVSQLIDVWLKYVQKQDLEQLEKDIEMPFKNLIIEMLENLYQKYCNDIVYIPVHLDDYSNYIIAPQDDKYTLEDFLLNRLLRNISMIIYSDESNKFIQSSYYDYAFGEVLIDKDRIQTKIPDVRQKRKLVIHEFSHGMKSQFYDGDFFDANKYYQMKEELKSIFGSKINDFSRKNSQPNYEYKHCGISYSSRFMKCNFNGLDVTDLDEILNENDAIVVTNDDYKIIAELTENCYMILNNPESSNTYITNYSFIVERLIDKETLFTGLYIEPSIFYNAFNSLYTKIFQNHFNSDLKALEILLLQLDIIKKNPTNIEEHIKLLNTLYDCIKQKYNFSEYNEMREKDIGCIGNKGLLEIVDGRLHPLSALAYHDEYEMVRGKTK